MTNCKVLVVDDDEGILEALSLILDDAGYSVETTTKGEETYKKVAEFNPDIIVLDVLMSGNDGRHICKNLKSDTATKNTPIIMISAHPNAEKGAKASGAEDFLAKPFDTDDILNLLEKYAKSRKAN